MSKLYISLSTHIPSHHFPRVCKHFCPLWLRQGVPSPFDTIQSLDKYCTTVAYSERHLPVVVWDPECRSIQVRGETIFLDDIPRAYDAVMEQAKSLLQWLTQGIETALTFPYSNLVDDLNDTTPGYSFLKTPFLEEYRFRLISHLVQNPKYVLRVADGNVEWNRVTAGEWMKKAQELNACLLFLIHLGSGQPARGTEILTMLFRNMQNVPRSLFAIPGGLASIIGYNKVCILSYHSPLTLTWLY